MDEYREKYKDIQSDDLVFSSPNRMLVEEDQLNEGQKKSLTGTTKYRGLNKGIEKNLKASSFKR